MNRDETFGLLGLITIVVVTLGAVLGVGMWGLPTYRVWSQAMSGKAALREAEWSRQILVEEAEAARLSEIKRAEGVAEANRIIGESLMGNEEYLRYLWLQTLTGENNKVIYIPTEANLPILEAGRLGSN